MHNVSFALDGAWKVLVAGLVLGAGLPALFAVGIRSLALGAAGTTIDAGLPSSASSDEPHPLGKILAVVCFAIVVTAVALGIVFIVVTGQGKVLSFEHVYPTVVPKS